MRLPCWWRPQHGAIDCLEGTIILTPNRRYQCNRPSSSGFTLLEILIILVILAIVSSVSYRSFTIFLQEQRLRQAAIELVSYLQTARARAMREADVSGQACELELQPSLNVVGPTMQTENVCNKTPALESIDLKLLSGIKDLSISGETGNIYYFTYTRQGLLASSNLSTSTALVLPRIIYLSTGSSQMQRCVLVDLASIRMGYRNSTAQQYCIYNGN